MGGGRFAAVAAGQGDGEGVGVDGWGSAAVAAGGVCGGEPVEGAFADEVAFHLGGYLEVLGNHSA
jgi:hypothetical protein